tara:strand:- start:475 stop:888 length:414 start_codon:yes stop_codon:yes gene_type:complete
MATDNINAKQIILFDGVCNLCNSSVLFVIKRDKKNRFRFAALQSDAGRRLAKAYGIDTAQTDSIILIEGQDCYAKSSAALRIARELSGAWPLLYGFILVPTSLRNWVYDWVAKNRYRWFGKKDSCMIPTASLQSKFL